MGHTDISYWEPAFDDLVLELNQTDVPSGTDDDHLWYTALSKFSRHSFARLFVSPKKDGLTIHLETVLGPPDDDDELAGLLRDRLSAISETEWSLDARRSDWTLETVIDADDKRGIDGLRRVLLDILEISEHFDAVSSTDEWFDILTIDEESVPQSEPSETEQKQPSPFETIGDGSSTEPAADGHEEATLESTATTRVDDRIVAAVGFVQVLAPRQREALTEGLEHHLHTKFEVQARRIGDIDRAELRMPSSARSVIYLEIEVGRFEGGLSDLQREVRGFFETLKKFSSYGVDLFEYLGVGETVFDDGHTTEKRSDDESESQLSFRRPATSGGSQRSQRPPAGDDDGVVLALDEDTTTSGASLKPSDYTDPRLQREDADTPLVDVVLRHPGYSDGRIGQVLSILLSIEYHDANDIADSAPCVIAWGLGQKRARRFKDVIESAGGKVLLVEPDTFGTD